MNHMIALLQVNLLKLAVFISTVRLTLGQFDCEGTDNIENCYSFTSYYGNYSDAPCDLAILDTDLAMATVTRINEDCNNSYKSQAWIGGTKENFNSDWKWRNGSIISQNDTNWSAGYPKNETDNDKWNFMYLMTKITGKSSDVGWANHPGKYSKFYICQRKVGLYCYNDGVVHQDACNAICECPGDYFGDHCEKKHSMLIAQSSTNVSHPFPVNMTCTFDGVPLPNITWQVNGKEFEEKTNFGIEKVIFAESSTTGIFTLTTAPCLGHFEVTCIAPVEGSNEATGRFTVNAEYDSLRDIKDISPHCDGTTGALSWVSTVPEQFQVKYQISYAFCESVVFNVIKTTPGFKHTGLEPLTSYQVNVTATSDSACTSGYQLVNHTAMVTGLPFPKLVSDAQTTLSPNTVKNSCALTWRYADYNKDEIQYFKIISDLTDITTMETSTEIQTLVVVQNNSSNFSFTDLFKSNSNITFKITAFNCVGHGGLVVADGFCITQEVQGSTSIPNTVIIVGSIIGVALILIILSVSYLIFNLKKSQVHPQSCIMDEVKNIAPNERT